MTTMMESVVKKTRERAKLWDDGKTTDDARKKVSFGGIQHVEKKKGNNRRVRLVKTFVDEPYNQPGLPLP